MKEEDIKTFKNLNKENADKHASNSYCPKTTDHFHVVERLYPNGPYHGCIECGWPIA